MIHKYYSNISIVCKINVAALRCFDAHLAIQKLVAIYLANLLARPTSSEKFIFSLDGDLIPGVRDRRVDLIRPF